MILDYERISDNICKAFHLLDDEFVIYRSAFRWKKFGSVISNGYESFCVETICEDNNWEIVCQFGEHIAICRQKLFKPKYEMFRKNS